MNNGLIDDSKCEEKPMETNNEFDLNKIQSNTTYYFELVAHNSLGNSTPAHVIITTAGKIFL